MAQIEAGSAGIGIGLSMVAAAMLAHGQDARIPAPHTHGPISIHRIHENQTVVDSTNWSGYAVTGPNNSVTSVSGSWIVPASTCYRDAPPEYASFWVGIDGWSSSTVEQIGTDSDCYNGVPIYYAWYEFYPENAFYAGPLTNLSPGDIISASVTYASNTGRFTVSITDKTRQLSFSTTYTPNSTTGTPVRSSAEWIVEAPATMVRRQVEILPLADFGLVDWGGDPTYAGVTATCFATIGGVNAAIGKFGSNGTTVFSTIMVNKATGAPMAVPNSLTPDGSSFFVTWKSVGP